MNNKTFNFKHSDLRYDTAFEFFIKSIAIFCMTTAFWSFKQMRVNNSGIFSILGIDGRSTLGTLLGVFIIICFIAIYLWLKARLTLHHLKKENCDGSIVFSSEEAVLCVNSGDYSIPYREIEEVQLTTHSPVIKLTILLEGLTDTPELVSLLNNEESAAEHVYSKIFQEFVSRKPEFNCSSKDENNRHVLTASAK